MKFFIFSSSYSILNDAFHIHFDIHLICSDHRFSILNGSMSMSFGKLKTMFAVKTFGKESTSDYSMIIFKVFEIKFECC